ncbi:p10 [Cyclophragma undans nucleopolyhedrovirus]|uniref:P10 n=1 Tax=Cyclophragma undans nucleopolyhedrovirus TaxID=1906244 RepID=A0A288QVV1_9ABAC|nr:p10 [Cyclophragma undans nucleopolyhedrovirus]AOT85489.1 p10 [Cyclophragma undans nucleopolyhedrovirus]
MSKPNVLTQILNAVQDVDAKVEALQAQVTELDGKVQLLDLEAVTAQLTQLDAKITDIQSILNGEDLPIPTPPLPLRAHKSPR